MKKLKHDIIVYENGNEIEEYIRGMFNKLNMRGQTCVSVLHIPAIRLEYVNGISEQLSASNYINTISMSNWERRATMTMLECVPAPFGISFTETCGTQYSISTRLMGIIIIDNIDLADLFDTMNDLGIYKIDSY